jgi:hypothetical protein
MLTEEQVQLSITGCTHAPLWLMPSIWCIDVVCWTVGLPKKTKGCGV